MATLDEARERWRQAHSKFAKQKETRVAYLGDGLGYAASNLYMDKNPAYVYARESMTEKRPFLVLNKNAVRPMFNLPVVLGYRDDDPDYEQVLSYHMASLERVPGSSVIGGIGPHHTQHEFGGGDEVYIDGRQFKPGLLRPTTPPTMAVTVLSFIFYYESWDRWAEADSSDLTTYVPNIGSRYLTICLDPYTNALVYRPGAILTGDFEALVNLSGEAIDSIPAPAGDEIPIGIILLQSTTTEINWNAVTVNNIYDGRLHLGFPARRLVDRIDTIERSTGMSRHLPATGAAKGRVTNRIKNTIDGGVF